MDFITIVILLSSLITKERTRVNGRNGCSLGILALLFGHLISTFTVQTDVRTNGRNYDYGRPSSSPVKTWHETKAETVYQVFPVVVHAEPSISQSIKSSQSFGSSAKTSQFINYKATIDPSVDTSLKIGQSIDTDPSLAHTLDTSSGVRHSIETSGSFGSDLKPTQQSEQTSNNEIVSAVVVALKELLHGLGPNSIKAQETGIHDTRSGHVFDGGSHVFDGGALGSGLLQNVDVSVEIMRVDQPVHDPPDIRKSMKETGRHNKPHKQKRLDFAIPYSWRQEALSHLDAKISEKREKAAKHRPRNIPLESLDVVLYSRDGVEVPKLEKNPRRRYKEKQSNPLDQLIPRRKDADQSARLGSRFTRENVKTNMLQLPMRQIYDKRSDISQELTRVGLRPQTKGSFSILRSAYSEMEPVRRTRAGKLSRSSQRRTREHAQSRRELRTDSPARSRSYKRDSRVISFGTSETWTPWLNQKLTPRIYQKLSQRLFQKRAPSRRLSQKRTPRLFQTLSHKLSRRRTRRLSYQSQTINPNSIRLLGKTSRRRTPVSRTGALTPYRIRRRSFSARRGPLSRAYVRRSRAPSYQKSASPIRTTQRRASFRETARGQSGNNLVRLRLPAFRYRPY